MLDLPRSRPHTLRHPRARSAAAASAGLLALLLSAAASQPAHTTPPPGPRPAAAGHPTFHHGAATGVLPGAAPTLRAGDPAPPILPYGPVPTLSPLETGPYINFESPPVKALAVDAAGTRLFVANTPAGTLAIFDLTTPGVPMRLIREIPVGLDPVTVAIQPGTGGRTVWTVNHLSDDLSVVDTQAGAVTRVVAVGDEPVNLLFSADGAFAYAVLQGPHALATPPFNQFPSLVTINTATFQIISALELDAHTARAAAIDHTGQRLCIAALHSGNNTTVVGEPIERDFAGIEDDDALPAIEIVRTFSATAALFAASPLAPYPDTSPLPGAPLVHRIVPDAAQGGDWSAIVATLTGPDGQPNPAMVALYAQETGALNAHEILARVIADAKDTRDHDVLIYSLANPASPALDRIISNAGATITAAALRPGNNELWLANLHPLNTVRLISNLRGRFMEHQVVRIDTSAASLALPPRPFDLHADIPNFDDVTAPNPDAIAASLSTPTDLIFSPDGRHLYVAALGTGRIGVIDASTGHVVARAESGRGTRSLALDPAGRRLFALNRTDHTITQFALDSADHLTPIATRALFNPEPASVRNGRDFLYSARFSNNAASSCAMCHIDGHLDHLPWDLGDAHMLTPEPAPGNVCGPAVDPCLVNHPLKGPMVTLSLRGLRDHEAFHWRGDRPQFSDFNSTFDALLGGSPLSDADMAAFDAFVKTMAYPPSPFWNADNSPRDPDVMQGLVRYATPASAGIPMVANCQACHNVQHDGASFLPGFTADGGMNLDFLFAQTQEVTQLRGLYKKFPSDLYTGVGLLHDGRNEREATDHPLDAFLLRFFRNLDTQSRKEVVAMVTAFPSNVTNVVGRQVRIRGQATPEQSADIATMITQHTALPSRCDVVAQGIISGVQRGYVLEPDPTGAATFRSDLDQTLTLDQIFALTTSGTLTFMAVPPGSGRRIGIDWDEDCLLNGLDPWPRASADFNLSGSVSVQDIFDFLAAIFAGEPAADFNSSGTISVQDLFDFLSAYFAGGC